MKSDKVFFRVAIGVSILVFLLVLLLNRRIIPAPETFPDFVRYLPMLNATINGLCSLLLISSFIAIRNKKIKLHKRINITTFLLSAIFLLSYVCYHYFIPEQSFKGEGVIRTVYFFILFTHIVLAALVLPLVLFTFYYALNDKIATHRKLVRYTFPIWLYVTITGVIVYLMISPYYTF